MDKAILPNGTTLNRMDKVNFRTNLGAISKGQVVNFKPLGEHGWMCVLDENGKYEWVSLALQLRYIGADKITA